jgi:DNA polymerase I
MIVYTPDTLRRELADLLVPDLPIFLDTETTGLNPRKDKLVLVIVMQEGWSEPLTLDVRQAFLTWDRVYSAAFADHLLVAHNAKFDLSFLWANGVKTNKVFCTQIAEQVLRGVGMEDAKVQGIDISLAGCAQQYGVRSKPVSKAEREWFYKVLPLDLDQPIPEAQLAYAAEDVRLLADIYQRQQEELESKPYLSRVIDLEMRVLPALAATEEAGIKIDVEGWRAFIGEKDAEAKGHADKVLETFGEAIVQERIRAYDQELAVFEQWEAAEKTEIADLQDEYDYVSKDGTAALGGSWGAFKKTEMAKWRAKNPRPDRPKLDTTPPNVGSSTQLLTAFGVLGLPFDTTDSKKLAPYEHEYPAIGTLVRFRKAQKFVDSFGESLLAFLGEDGRIHPDYHQIGASTGRMSCTRPNWQQIPSRGDGKRLRQCVVATPGHKLLTADFSNIEMRILAEYSRDARLLDFFDRDVDLHSEVARLMFGLGAEVDPKHTDCPAVPGWTYRDVAKTINYGLVYGMSASRLARTALIPKGEAARLMMSYFGLFPGVVAWLEEARKRGLKKMCSGTMLGRIRPYHLPPKPKDWEARREWDMLVARIERQSMNTPIQGTSADITKEAHALSYEGGLRVVAVVHDELVVEARTEQAEMTAGLLAYYMNEAQYSTCRLRKDEPPRVALAWPEVHISDRWEK